MPAKIGMCLGLFLAIPVLAIVISIGLVFHWIYAIALTCVVVYVIWTGRRSVLATLAVALCAMAIVYGDLVGSGHPWYLPALLLILPLAVAAAAHAAPARALVRAVPDGGLDARLGAAGRRSSRSSCKSTSRSSAPPWPGSSRSRSWPGG